MSFELVRQLQEKAVAVGQVCRVLQVSRSGYYAARRRSRVKPVVCEVSVHLQAAFAASGRSYGSRRLRTALASRGVAVGRYRIGRLMRQHGLRSSWKRKFVHTTDSKHALPISPNVLNRQFNPTRPNQAWVADMTYIRTRSGWLYLAVVLDLFARKVVGWAMAPDMQAGLVCRALQLAIAQRQPAPGLIVHTDRGSQYASAAHQAVLDRHGLIGSMSRKGNCWDNAVMERFFLNLKMERVWQRDYANHAEATTDIADYIVGFYNSVRLHSKLGNLPPNAFEHQSAIKQPIGVCDIT
jgi:transposase InsO family protein